MFTRVLACSRELMEHMVGELPELTEKHCLISIVDSPSDRVFGRDSSRVKTLVFHDVSLERLASLNEAQRAPYALFSPAQADEIIEFLLCNHARPQREFLLVHCTLGVSRSGAVAAFANELLGLDSQRFSEDNPNIRPLDRVKQILEERWNEYACALSAQFLVAC